VHVEGKIGRELLEMYQERKNLFMIKRYGLALGLLMNIRRHCKFFLQGRGLGLSQRRRGLVLPILATFEKKLGGEYES